MINYLRLFTQNLRLLPSPKKHRLSLDVMLKHNILKFCQLLVTNQTCLIVESHTDHFLVQRIKHTILWLLLKKRYINKRTTFFTLGKRLFTQLQCSSRRNPNHWTMRTISLALLRSITNWIKFISYCQSLIFNWVLRSARTFNLSINTAFRFSRRVKETGIAGQLFQKCLTWGTG